MLCAFWSPQCWWETNAKENSLVVRRAVGGRGVGSARDFTFMVGLLMCALTLSRDEVLLKRGLETWEKARQKAATGCDEIRTMRAGRGLEEVAAVLLELQAGVTLQICVIVHDSRGLGSEEGRWERRGVTAGHGEGKVLSRRRERGGTWAWAIR